MKNKTNVWMGVVLVFVIGILLGTIIAPRFQHAGMDMHEMSMEEMSMDEKRTSFISMREDVQDEQRSQQDYRCCLEKPCTYCIEKSPGHGEGAACHCLDDVVNGVHPCGECIGEILEGHGNPYLSEYFAKAIAEKTGHIDAIKQIIEEKYDIPVEEQV